MIRSIPGTLGIVPVPGFDADALHVYHSSQDDANASPWTYLFARYSDVLDIHIYGVEAIPFDSIWGHRLSSFPV